MARKRQRPWAHFFTIRFPPVFGIAGYPPNRGGSAGFVVVRALLALVAGLSGFAVPAPAAAQDITLTWSGRTSGQFWQLYERWSQDYTVKLTSRPSADVTVTIGEGAVCPATGSFTVDTDLETSGNQDTLTFTDSNWDDAQTVRITATADADTNDNTRLCQVQHSAAGGGYDGVTKPKFLFNQEFPGRVSGTFVQKTVNGLEGSKNRTYRVWLSHAPNADVTVTITFKSGDSDISIDTDADTEGNQNTLTFTTSDWADSGKAVTIHTAEDGDALRGKAVFTHTATGGGYDHSIGERVVDVTIWEVDDDDPPSKPTGLSATAGDASADLAWNSSVNLPNHEYWTYSKWQYRYKTTGGYGSWTDIADSGPNTTSHTVTGLTNGTLHTFQIRAYNDVAGAASDEATAMPLAPLSFGTNTIPDYSLARSQAIATVTLPEASGGLAPLAYSLEKTTGSPTLPPGLTFTAASRQLSGTPTTMQTAAEYTYTVTDSATPANTATLTFDVAVTADSAPSLGAVTDRSFHQGSAIGDVVLPAATGGNAPITYTLARTNGSPALPPGLRFDGATRTLSGTPTGTQSAVGYTYTATDSDNDAATAAFDITVTQDHQPSFGDQTVADRTWYKDLAIGTVTLPAATGGDTPLTYTLAKTDGTPALPPGLSFAAATRQLTGTPTATQSAAEYTYTVTDNDGDTATLTFDVGVGINTAPTADAGADRRAALGATVTLDASKSSDPEKQTLTFAWTHSGGSPSVALTGADTASPSFTAPASLSSEADLTFTLTVTDPGGLTATDTVTVTVATATSNRTPTANAGADRNVREGATVTLDGSKSSDPELETLTYAWAQKVQAPIPIDPQQPPDLTPPVTPTVTLTGATTVKPTFTAPDVSGDTPITFTLKVTDASNNESTADEVTITVKNNNQPAANAGADQTVAEGASVTLDGSGSNDLDSGDTLTYSWSQTDGTPDVILTGATTAKPTFTAPSQLAANASLTFTLTVSDGLKSDTDTVTVTVTAGANDAPAANAGPDQTVGDGAVVTLDGSASTDPEKQTLAYAWSQTAGTTVTLSSTTIAKPVFTAPGGLASDTSLTFSLTVTDPGGLASSADTVTITVQANTAPTADAGSDRYAAEGATVTLDGSASSDAETRTLTYAWTHSGGLPAVTLTGPATASPSFTAPTGLTQDAALTFTLTVTDERGLTATDTVVVTVATAANNQAPTADAGPDQTVSESLTVTLDGSASADREGESLAWAWTQTGSPAVTLSSATAAKPTFTAPAVAADTTLTFSLTVTAGGKTSAADTVTVTVKDNAAPTANAGADQTVFENTTATLDASASSDPESQTLTYAWTQIGSPAVTLSSATAASPTFTAPAVEGDTPLTFSLTVTDSLGRPSAADTVTVTVANNTAPTADAGADQTVTEGVTVTLDASASRDAESSALTYAWSQTSGPTATLSSATAQKPTFTAPAVASNTDLVFSLTVTDPGGLVSAADTVTITVGDNTAPVANAGADQTVAESAAVTLDAGASTDPDSQTLTYAWTQTTGTNVTLSSAAAAKPTFTAPSGLSDNAALTFRLTVTDAGGLTATDTVTVTVVAAANNQAPTANAGVDQTVAAGLPVTLDGNGSYDPEGETLTWAWSQTAGPTVTLSSASADSPTFTAPSSAATLTFSLTVTAGGKTSAADTVTITVTATANAPPVAHAGADRRASEGATVTLDGSASNDPDDQTLTWAWSHTSGLPAVNLTGANTAKPTFTAPTGLSTDTALTFTLTVTDPGGLTGTDTVTITVPTTANNNAPTANAGADQTAATGATVTLDGSASSDPEGDALTFAWSQTGGTNVTLSSATTESPTFTAPASAATLTFSLTVTAGGKTSAADTVTITVQANTAPTANAGADQTVVEGARVTLDGSASSDPESQALTWAWTRTAGPAVTLSSTTAANPTFTAPTVAADTTITFSLTVTDSDGLASSADTVTVTVENNTAPTANAGADRRAAQGTSVTLDGSASSDADNETLTFAWSQTAGTNVTLSDATVAKPTFTAPSSLASDAVLTFRLTVTDPNGATGTDTVTITVPTAANNRAPTADAGRNRAVQEDARVQLDGSGSSDPEGETLTFAWTQTSGPSVTLNDADTAKPRFRAPAQLVNNAALVFRLTVTAGGKSATDTVRVRVTAGANDAPTADAGPDQRVGETATVTLDGSGSNDPEGETLTYAWTQVGSPAVTLSSATAASPTFTAPTVAADTDLTFSLTVTDARGLASPADTVTVTVRDGAPTANAGPDQKVIEGATVTLNGAGSRDPDGETLTYAWTQIGTPAVTLSSATAASPTFTAPTVNADTKLTFSLTVTDAGGLASTADTVSVTVDDNDPPVADAGADQTVLAGASVTLDGSASRDPEKQTLTFAWAQLPTPPAATIVNAVTLTGPSTAGPTFNAPQLTRDATLTFGLLVTDPQGLVSATDTVQVLVQGVPAAPAGLTAAYAYPGVTLSWTDPNDSAITKWQYRWRRSTGQDWDYWEDLPNSGATTTSAKVAGGAGATLVFQVRAVNANGAGLPSNTASELMPPLPPTGLESTGGDGQVTLSWTDPLDSSITSWEYRRKTGEGYQSWITVQNSGATTTSATVTGLDNGFAYTFQVRAVNATAAGGDSGDVAAMTIPAKRKVTATAGAGQVTLGWGGPSLSHVTKFQYRKKSAGATGYGAWTDVPGSSASTTGYTVTGLAPGTEYAFQVRAVNAGGHGVASDEVKATPTGDAATEAPAAPTIFIGTGDAKVRLSWNDPDDKSISRYDYRQKTAGSWGAAESIPDSGSSTTSHIVTGLTNGSSYAIPGARREQRRRERLVERGLDDPVPQADRADRDPPRRRRGSHVDEPERLHHRVLAGSPPDRRRALRLLEHDRRQRRVHHLAPGDPARQRPHLRLPGPRDEDRRREPGFRRGVGDPDPRQAGRLRGKGRRHAGGADLDRSGQQLDHPLEAPPQGREQRLGILDPDRGQRRLHHHPHRHPAHQRHRLPVPGAGGERHRRRRDLRHRHRDAGGVPAGPHRPHRDRRQPDGDPGLDLRRWGRDHRLAVPDAGGIARLGPRPPLVRRPRRRRGPDPHRDGTRELHRVRVPGGRDQPHRPRLRLERGPSHPPARGPRGADRSRGNRGRPADHAALDPGRRRRVAGHELAVPAEGGGKRLGRVDRRAGERRRDRSHERHDLPLQGAGGERGGRGRGERGVRSDRAFGRGAGRAGRARGEDRDREQRGPLLDEPGRPLDHRLAVRAGRSARGPVRRRLVLHLRRRGGHHHRHGHRRARRARLELQGPRLERHRRRRGVRRGAAPARGAGAGGGQGRRPTERLLGRPRQPRPGDLGVHGAVEVRRRELRQRAPGDDDGDQPLDHPAYERHGVQRPRAGRANSAGDGDWSSVVTGTPGANPPLAPSRPQATAGNAQVSLAWTAGGNGGAAITSWKYRQKAGAGDWGDWTPIPGSGASTTSHTVTTLTNGTEYTFQVRAVNSAGDGTASDDSNPVTPSTSGPTVPAAPASLQATPGNAQAVLSWTAGDDGDAAITSWKVRQKAGTNAWGAWTPIPNSDASTTSHTATTLTNGTEYTFQVRAVNSVGDGAASDETTATPAGPPGAPTDLKVDVESHQRLLAAWKAPADNGGAAITHYLVQWKSGSQEFSTARQVQAGAAPDTDGFVKRGLFDLTNGTTYTLRVRAVSSGGAGPWSSTVTGTPKATVPDAPVIEVEKGNTRLEVSWTAPASNGSAITGYTVQWTTDDEPWSSSSPQRTVTGTTASITGLTNGTKYFVRVRATNGAGDSDWSIDGSGTPSAVPDAPAGLVIRTWDRFLTFGWTAPEDNGSDITGYTVQWKSGSEKFGAGNREHTTTKTQHSWGALVNGTTYTYRVRATNANGDGPWSAEMTGIPGHAPLKPTPFTATGGDGQATLAWTSGGDGGSPITKWQLRRQTSTNVWGDWTDIDGSGASTTSHTVTGLDNGRTYTFQVRAVNTTGGGAASDSSVATMLPAKPAGFAATPNDGSVALSWTSPNNASITRWEYRYKTGSGDFGSWTEVASSGASTTSASVTLANGKTYGFELRAVNATGNGAASDEATATMIPAAPANIAAASGNAKVLLSWTDPGNATITGWEYRIDANNAGWQAWTEMSGSSASTTSHLVGSLNNNSSFRFQVRAVNATGDGKPSAAVTAAPRNVTVRLSVSPIDHGEDEGAATVTVTAALAHPLGGSLDTFPVATTVTVKVGATGDSATSGTDYTAVDDFDVTIPANSRSGTGTFTLTPTDDTEGEELETITVSGTAPGLSVTGASLTLSDDETNAFVFSKATVNLEETASPTGTYTVRLSKLPTDEVSVTLASGDAAAVTPNPTTLTFAISNYRMAQTVTLTAVADGDGTDESVSITHTASGGGYAGVTGTVTAAIDDDDSAPTANAGADRQAATGATVTLDGSASTDPESQTLTFAWSHTGGSPTVTLTGADTATPSFPAPTGLTQNAALTFTLTVTDPGGRSATDTVTVTVVTAANNQAPTAKAGADRSVREGAFVTLDGSGTSDPELETLTWAWTQKLTTLPTFPTNPPDNQPPPSLPPVTKIDPVITLTGANTARPTFTAPEITEDTPITFVLTVTDGADNTSTDEVTITVKNNQPPAANAGPDQTVAEGAAVTLDGSGSNDLDSGDTLTYSWSQTGGTPNVTLTGATAAKPTFTAPSQLAANASLTFTLTVSDGLKSHTDTVTITVTAGANDAPTANAGPDQTVGDGASVTLDGSASTDPENETLSYAWSQTAGTTVTLSSATIAKPVFTAPAGLASDTTLTFSLTVTDSGGLASSADTVTITVQANTAPTADAGADQRVAEGAAVTLDGSASRDAETRTLAYAWVHSGGSPAVTLTGPTTASPRFTAPTGLTQDAALVFTLTVTDGRGLTDTDTVTVTVTAASNNQAPTANAGADQTISEGLTVTLDGSASSDREGEALTWAWTQTGTPAVTLSSTTAAKPTFTAPAVAADTNLTFSLTVTAGGKTSSADTVQVTVKDNAAPVANAGPDQTVVESQAVTLDGSGSSDADGQTLTWAWTQPGGPPVTLSGTTVAKPTFTAPDVVTTTVLTFSLTVTDPLGRASTADTVQVAVQVNTAPTANAGPDQSVVEGQTVTLDASGSTDPESQTLSYAWTRTAGPAVTLSSATAAKPTFTAPAVAADTALTFSVTVTDPGGLASTDTVTVTVGDNTAPTANAGADQTVVEDQTVTLDAGASTDPESQTLSYAWTQTAGATVALSSATAVRPTFTAPKDLADDATLTFRLTATDPGGLTSTDTVTITVTAAANNTAPTANAGADRTVITGARVTLDGSASRDPQNHALTYAWSQTGGSPAVAFDAGSATPAFVAPTVAVDTTLTFSLTVTDTGGLASSPDTVTVTVQVDTAPTANAGADRRAAEGATVTLDGSASYDREKQTLTYAWSQTGGSPDVTLTAANTAKPTFTAPSGLESDASLTFTLTVTDPGGLAGKDTVTITVPIAANNRAPTADAGPDRTAVTGATVTLDGSASRDPEGETLSYAWTQTAGTNVTLSSATAVRPTFTAPASASTLTFSLTVTAGGMTSTADTVTITVQANTAPTADAGPDRTAATGAKVTLDGSASSDPEGETLSYAWTQTGGTNVTLSSATAARPTFTAPASASTLTFSLTVTAGGMTSAADTVTITVQASTAPTADAGADQTVEEGALAVLDGSASNDPENQALTYAWTQTGGSPNVTLSSATATRPAFTAPSVTADTDLVFSLTVTDAGGLSSAADTVTITVRNNVAPTADAGADQRVGEGAAVALDGSGSSDPEGGTLTYAWTQTGGSPNVALTGAATAKPTFTAPSGLSANAVLTFTLTVTDPQGNTGTDTVTVTVPTATNNTAPTADAGTDQTVAEGATVTLDGSGSSDPEGDALTYAWTRTAGPTVTLTGATTASPTFTAPSQLAANATLTFSLTVTAGGKSSTADTVTVTVTAGANDAPTARAGTDQRVAESATVTLDGSASSDPEGETLTFAWTQTAGTTVQLSSSTAAKPTFTAPSSLSANETLTFSLTVTDARSLGSTADTVDVVVVSAANNQAPTADAGRHIRVKEGAKVRLNGSASSDPEGEALTFAWTQTSGPTVTLNDADTARPRFQAPAQLLSDKRLIFKLTVTAGGKTATDTVRVRVLAGANDAPTADAGANQTTFAAFKVTLDGSGSSDPEGQTLKYAWAQLPTPPATETIAHPVTLSSASAVSPTFTAPTVSEEADLVFGLKVTRPGGPSVPDRHGPRHRPPRQPGDHPLEVRPDGPRGRRGRVHGEARRAAAGEGDRPGGAQDRPRGPEPDAEAAHEDPRPDPDLHDVELELRPDPEDPGRRGRRRRQRHGEVHPHRERRRLRRHHRPAHRHRERQRHPGHRPLGRQSHGRRELHQGLQGQARHQAQRRRHRDRRAQEHGQPGRRHQRRDRLVAHLHLLQLELRPDRDPGGWRGPRRRQRHRRHHPHRLRRRLRRHHRRAHRHRVRQRHQGVHPVLALGSHGDRGLHQGLQDQARHPAQRRRHRHHRTQDHRHPGLRHQRQDRRHPHLHHLQLEHRPDRDPGGRRGPRRRQRNRRHQAHRLRRRLRQRHQGAHRHRVRQRHQGVHPVLALGSHGDRGLHQGLQDQARHPAQRRRHRHHRAQDRQRSGLRHQRRDRLVAHLHLLQLELRPDRDPGGGGRPRRRRRHRRHHPHRLRRRIRQRHQGAHRHRGRQRHQGLHPVLALGSHGDGRLHQGLQDQARHPAQRRRHRHHRTQDRQRSGLRHQRRDRLVAHLHHQQLEHGSDRHPGSRRGQRRRQRHRGHQALRQRRRLQLGHRRAHRHRVRQRHQGLHPRPDQHHHYRGFNRQLQDQARHQAHRRRYRDHRPQDYGHPGLRHQRQDRLVPHLHHLELGHGSDRHPGSGGGPRRRQRHRGHQALRQRRRIRLGHRRAHRHRERQRHQGLHPQPGQRHRHRGFNRQLQDQARHKAQRQRHRHRRPQDHGYPGLRHQRQDRLVAHLHHLELELRPDGDPPGRSG